MEAFRPETPGLGRAAEREGRKKWRPRFFFFLGGGALGTLIE